MKDKNLEVLVSGIKCDNPKCDYRDDSVKAEDYPGWINKPCPKCGENLLTEEDYNSTQMMHALADFMNSLTEEEIAEIAKGVDLEELKATPVFADAKGFENMTAEGKVSLTLNVHNGLKVDEIKKVTE